MAAAAASGAAPGAPTTGFTGGTSHLGTAAAVHGERREGANAVLFLARRAYNRRIGFAHRAQFIVAGIAGAAEIFVDGHGM